MRPHFSHIVWPDAAAYWIANARVPLCMLGEASPGAQYDRDDGVVLVDLLIESERLARMVPAGTAGTDEHPLIDLRGRQVWPMLGPVQATSSEGTTRAPGGADVNSECRQAYFTVWRCVEGEAGVD